MNIAILSVVLIVWAILMIVWGTITIKLIIELYLYLQKLIIKPIPQKLKPIKKNVTKRISRTTRKV